MCVSVSVNLEALGCVCLFFSFSVCVPFLLVEKGKLIQLQVNFFFFFLSQRELGNQKVCFLCVSVSVSVFFLFFCEHACVFVSQTEE